MKEKAKDVRADNGGDAVLAALEEQTRKEASARWQDLAELETVAGEVAAEFDGEDPLSPEVREILRDTRAELEELLGEIGERLGGLELGEPDEEMLAAIRKSVGLPPPA